MGFRSFHCGFNPQEHLQFLNSNSALFPLCLIFIFITFISLSFYSHLKENSHVCLAHRRFLVTLILFFTTYNANLSPALSTLLSVQTSHILPCSMCVSVCLWKCTFIFFLILCFCSSKLLFLSWSFCSYFIEVVITHTFLRVPNTFHSLPPLF